MFDMTVLIVALIAVICLAIAFFGASENSDGGSPILAGVSTVKKFYGRHMKKPNSKCTVLYINIFYENLQTMIDRKEVSYIRDQIENEVLQLCSNAHGEAARVDGNNYIVATDLSQNYIEGYCRNFLEADKKGFKMLEVFLGIYVASEEDTDFQKAAGYAKKASRAAKAAESKFVMADKNSLQLIIENDNIERNIEYFIDNNAFYQMYQPLFYAATGEVAGCEALTRLRDEKVNDILPSKFLNAIKKEKLYGKFDMYVFRRCCEWAVKRADWKLIMTCNFAKSTLAADDAVEDIISIASDTGISRDMIVISVDTDSVDKNWDAFRKNVARLKQAGFKIGLDKFGKGYTVLGDMTNLAPDAIEIDRSLVTNGVDGQGRDIFDTVVNLAKKIDAMVMCSGIETEEQKRIAVEAGCDILQGFYLCKPLSEDDFDELLTELGKKELDLGADEESAWDLYGTSVLA